MTERYPIRARVFRAGTGWRVILPTGRRLWYRQWWMAIHYANLAVYKEREYFLLKNMTSEQAVEYWKEKDR